MLRSEMIEMLQIKGMLGMRDEVRNLDDDYPLRLQAITHLLEEFYWLRAMLEYVISERSIESLSRFLFQMTARFDSAGIVSTLPQSAEEFTPTGTVLDEFIIRPEEFFE